MYYVTHKKTDFYFNAYSEAHNFATDGGKFLGLPIKTFKL